MAVLDEAVLTAKHLPGKSREHWGGMQDTLAKTATAPQAFQGIKSVGRELRAASLIEF